MKKEIESHTRSIFHKIHSEQLAVPSQMERTFRQTDFEAIGFDKGYFNGKTCLEAGCGSFAPATYNMLRNGASFVYAIDLNESIFEHAPNMLNTPAPIIRRAATAEREPCPSMGIDQFLVRLISMLAEFQSGLVTTAVKSDRLFRRDFAPVPREYLFKHST